MGNESSVPVEDDVPPATLRERTLEAVAEYIKERNVKRIVVMTGAGISTSAGIPDFRSPETGLYANLARLNLPFAEAVFDISYFRHNPLPFYTLAHELFPGKYKPTIAHSFIKLLHDKGRLLKLFTQNIDCLEREAGVPGDMIVEAHGSFATQRCIDCHTDFPEDLMKKTIMAKEVPHCLRETCVGLVKPDIVFFGEALPEAFHKNRSLPSQADLAIVMGTSLTVQPFASLPSFVREETPRILINLERVGGLGGRADDVLLLGDCDAGVRKLADALGWREELEELWKKTASLKAGPDDQNLAPKSRDETLESEVEKLTREIDKSLKVTEEHTTWLKDHLTEQYNLHEEPKDKPAASTSVPAASTSVPAASTSVPAVSTSVPAASTSVPAASTSVPAPAAEEADRGGNEAAAGLGDAKSSDAPTEALDEDKPGIAHVYPHTDQEAPRAVEKPSL